MSEAANAADSCQSTLAAVERLPALTCAALSQHILQSMCEHQVSLNLDAGFASCFENWHTLDRPQAHVRCKEPDR